jgi:hypothetical protein
MWKKQDETVGAQPDFASKESLDSTSFSDALAESLINDRPKKEKLAVLPTKSVVEDQNATLPSAGKKTYSEVMNEFTRNATAFMEHLPLLAKARAAYDEAMKASAEMRKVLDSGDEHLRTLMAQLEQGISAQSLKQSPDKKNPEAAKVERMTGTDEGGARTTRWP